MIGSHSITVPVTVTYWDRELYAELARSFAQPREGRLSLYDIGRGRHAQELALWLVKRAPEVRDRILRLNPDPKPGGYLRGWHPSQRWARPPDRDVLSRGFLIKTRGRAWFEAFAAKHPPAVRRGRRHYWSLRAVWNESRETP